ncbi:FHA domain-containing protein [Plantactinospora siamensis]|uniref:FHA domain-containing protein n=1 Tax=Plantactinospora siamensis TaxID=555372 RepID=A0ABV6NXW8_9ACTN
MKDEPGLLPVLSIASGGWQGVSFRLQPGTWTVGRQEDSDILLVDAKVSRRHAEVVVADGEVVLRDIGSTNGTWHNDRRITEPTALRDGDRLQLGHVRLLFFDPAMATTDPVGAPLLLPARPAEPVRGAPGALVAPTQILETAVRSSGMRLAMLIGGCAALAGGLAVAYQIFQ